MLLYSIETTSQAQWPSTTTLQVAVSNSAYWDTTNEDCFIAWQSLVYLYILSFIFYFYPFLSPHSTTKNLRERDGEAYRTRYKSRILSHRHIHWVWLDHCVAPVDIGWCLFSSTELVQSAFIRLWNLWAETWCYADHTQCWSIIRLVGRKHSKL